jgi:hypothetical protein
MEKAIALQMQGYGLHRSFQMCWNFSLDICIVVGTLVITFGVLTIYAWASSTLQIPNAIATGIGVILLVMLVATPYWIYRLSKKANPDELAKEVPTIKRFAIVLTWLTAVAAFIIDIYTKRDSPVVALMLVSGAFGIPLYFLYKDRFH